jgi:dTDP-4-amino-4,6-dideoxygalactose transaminase
MREENLLTKNIPDALNWHFAGNWGHIYKEYGIYTDSFTEQWKATEAILYSSVALPIMVKMTEEQIESTIDKICKISKMFL